MPRRKPKKSQQRKRFVPKVDLRRLMPRLPRWKNASKTWTGPRRELT